MTFSQLRAFVAVADNGSVVGAARALVVSQPAVSAALAALQKDLGVALVRRDGRRIKLTPAGARFAVDARRLLGQAELARDAARSTESPETGTLHLASVTTAAEHVLPRELASFRRAHPAVDVRLEVGNRSAVWRLLEGASVELALAGRPAASVDAEVRAVRPNHLILVAHPRVSSRPTPTLDQLESATWLLREHGSGTRAAVEEVLGELAIQPPCLTLGSNGAIRETLRAGLGVAMVSEDLIAEDLRRRRLVKLALRGLPLDRPWRLLAPRDPPPSPTAELFVDHLLSRGHGWRAPTAAELAER